jgi:hypothetical protein
LREDISQGGQSNKDRHGLCHEGTIAPDLGLISIDALDNQTQGSAYILEELRRQSHPCTGYLLLAHRRKLHCIKFTVRESIPAETYVGNVG